MKQGDKVRFIHSKGEGIVRKIIDSKNIEVEIEEGFIVPFLKSELVVVHSEESILSGRLREEIIAETTSVKGDLYLAFVPFNDKIFSLYLVNNTSEEVLFTIGQERKETYQGITSGILKNGTFLKYGEASISDFENWPEWIIQALFFRPGTTFHKEPLSKKIKIKANSFFKNKQTIPVLNKEGHSFKIDASAVSVNVNPQSVVNNMFKPSPSEEKLKVPRPSKEIDLHIEKLTSDHEKMSNSEKLKIQLQTFEKNLENAVASEMEEIIFIHGVGNGVLRQEVHKALSKNKGIKFYQDARKEKFGYGATLVRLK